LLGVCGLHLWKVIYISECVVTSEENSSTVKLYRCLSLFPVNCDIWYPVNRVGQECWWIWNSFFSFVDSIFGLILIWMILLCILRREEGQTPNPEALLLEIERSRFRSR